MPVPSSWPTNFIFRQVASHKLTPVDSIPELTYCVEGMVRAADGSLPLPKGLACTRCKARKTRCSGEKPACQACIRSARFKHKSLEEVACIYVEAPAYGTPSSGSTSGSSFASNSMMRRSASEFESPPVSAAPQSPIPKYEPFQPNSSKYHASDRTPQQESASTLSTTKLSGYATLASQDASSTPSDTRDFQRYVRSHARASSPRSSGYSTADVSCPSPTSLRSYSPSMPGTSAYYPPSNVATYHVAPNSFSSSSFPSTQLNKMNRPEPFSSANVTLTASSLSNFASHQLRPRNTNSDSSRIQSGLLTKDIGGVALAASRHSSVAERRLQSPHHTHASGASLRSLDVSSSVSSPVLPYYPSAQESVAFSSGCRSHSVEAGQFRNSSHAAHASQLSLCAESKQDDGLSDLMEQYFEDVHATMAMHRQPGTVMSLWPTSNSPT